MRTAFRALALALALAADVPARAESAAERSVRSLLAGLEERRMPDVMLWVVDRAATTPGLSDAFKAELPFRRAEALVGLSRTEGDAAKRTAYLDAAEQELDTFLAKSPTGDAAINAYLQKGNLLVDRGQRKAEQAKRPGQDAAKLSAEAIGYFDAAVKALKGTVKPDQTDIPSVTNAEDAVIKQLRDVDARIAAVKPAAREKGKPAAKPAPEQQKELERLDDLRTRYQGQLLSTRILVGAALFEKSKVWPAGSKQAVDTLAESTAIFQGIAEKYAATAPAAATYARYYWGRNLAAAGRHEQAADTLAAVAVIDGKSPVAVTLKAKALNTSLECWLAMVAAEKDPAKGRRILERFDETLRKFAVTTADKLPGRKLDAEWLALKYRAAVALDALAGRIDPKDKQSRGLLQRDARKLAIEVATANKDFGKEARDLAAKLGKELPDADGDRDLASLVADARVAFGVFQEKQADVKRLQAAGQAADATAKAEEAAAARNEAVTMLEAVVKAGGGSDSKDDVAMVNASRSMLAYAFFDAKRYADAAAIGTLLMEQFPNSPGSRQSAKVALASLQQLALQAEPSAAAEARARLGSFATSMVKTWPAEAEAADAAAVLLNAAIEAHDAPRMLALVQGFPKESPRRAEFLLRAGPALRREAQEARRLEEGTRPDDATIAGWNAAARGAIDEGLASLEGAAALPAGPAAKIVLTAALARVQMALEDGDRAAATRILEHPAYGPWRAVEAGDATVAQGPLAEGTLTVALRHFIETEQFDKAQQAMAALERAAGTGEEASARLTNMYLVMGRDLHAQLEALGSGPTASSPEVRERARRILDGFEKFLEGISKRDPKTSSRIWVATTYFTLGSGKGTGAVVPKQRAEQYLDRSAATYGELLARKDAADVPERERAELASFEPSIRLKLAGIYRERGRWDEAQQQLDWILADAKRQNSLEIQVQAAELLEAAGRAAAAAGDTAKADALLREAAGGRKGAAAIWGWGGIANKLSRQAFAGADERSLKARDQFFQARLHVAETLLARAKLGGPAGDREKRLDTATSAIAMTRKLYPDLGGEGSRQRFEKLLKEIQKEQGATTPGGFAQLDAEAAAVATP